MNPDDPVKYVLIMNLDWVTVNDVRTWTKALLLEEGPGMFDKVRRAVRGIGTDPAWPVFDIFVPSIEYTLEDAQSNSIIMSDATPNGRPLCTGAIMKLKDGPEMQLVVRDHKLPLDIHTFEGTWGDGTITDKLWDRLSRLAPKYWNAPYMPSLVWGPTPGFTRY
jgi:hypothetical protein